MGARRRAAATSSRGRSRTAPSIPRSPTRCPTRSLVVELEEGPRLVGNLRDLAPSELALDLAVDVVFEPVADNVALTHFTTRRRLAAMELLGARRA